MGTHEPIDVGVHPGDVLAGKYRVERVLGVGGMGVVVAAHHVQLDTKIALKFLLPSMLSNREAVARFSREARAAVRIMSEHVARVIDVGTLENGAPYMVMEYLEGGDLAAWLQQRGPLPIEQAVEFVLHACVAIAEAHGLGIVHRDLKPANLFCIRRSDGQLSVKVLDFGISKVSELSRGSEPSGMSVTKTSALMGSPLYMSPEQMQSAKGVDAQTDIWALGVILYELLTGHVPFDGEAVPEVAIKVAMQPPTPLRGFRPEVPVALEAVVLKCLEKDRLNRYPNVAELAIALAEFAPKRARASIERITNTIQASGLSVSALAMPPSPLAQRTATAISAGTMSPVGHTTPGVTATTAPPRRGLVMGIALAGILVVGGAGVVILGRGGASHQATPAQTSGPPVAASLPLPPPSETATASTPLPVDSTSAIVVVEAGLPSRQQLLTAQPYSHPPTPTAAAPSPPVAAPPTQMTTTPPVAPAAGHVSPSCDPPFTLDDQGRKHFKPECFLKK